jgi:hypothetical protein
MSCSEASLNSPAMYWSGRKFGSLSVFISTLNPGPLPGDGPRARSLDEANWFGNDGTDGTGGAVGSKSEGRLLNRVEYRRLTRSEV